MAPPSTYDPFARGGCPAGVRTLEAFDTVRGRTFPYELWYPASPRHDGEDLAEATQDLLSLPSAARRQPAVRDAAPRPGAYPLIVYSHGSARDARRMATFLCTHLASHGFVVAAADHSEVIAPELAPKADETDEQRQARARAIVGSRVPDIRFLLDHLLDRASWGLAITLDADRVGLAGYSFGGWTVLAALEVEWRVRAVVALAPGGSSRPKPGILAAPLTFEWGRDVPTLYIAAEQDTMTTLDGMRELFDRTRSVKHLAVIPRAGHLHFLDEVAREHELARTMAWPEPLAWIPREMRPIGELCPPDEAHRLVRGLTTTHFDAVLRQNEKAKEILKSGDLIQ